MNMKQSCKALIFAIEGELDGRHCTEEQAAAILDHALPSLTEALVRVEAERDTAIVQMQNIRKERDRINKELGDTGFNLCIAQQQLAEAVGLLRKVAAWPAEDCTYGQEQVQEAARVFLARHAQAEQQEARAALATQPSAGEPRPEFFVEFATLRRAMSIYGLSAPESNHELGSQMERYAIRVIEAVAKLPFPYPHAAAHGDEAVRADAQRWRYGAKHGFPDAMRQTHPEEGPVFWVRDWQQDGEQFETAEAAIDAAMRAQGDGEVQ